MKIKTEHLLGGAAVLAVGYWLWARNQRSATITAAQISRQPAGPHKDQMVTWEGPFGSSSQAREMERGTAYVRQMSVGPQGATATSSSHYNQPMGTPSTSRVAAQPGHPQDLRGRMSAPLTSFRPQSGSGTRRVPN